MRVRWHYLKALASVIIPIMVATMIIGWADQHARGPVGGGASALAVATPTLAAYPLPGQPSGPSTAAKTATPTRLAAYPLPGTATPVLTSSKSAGPLTVLTTTLPYSLFLPLIRNDCYFKGTAGVNTTAQPGDLWYTNTLAMGVCAGYEWNHVYTPTYVAYSEPWLVINDVRSRNYSDSLTTYVITWNVSIDGGICPGARGYSLTLGVYDPLPDGQAALGRCITYIAASRPGMYWLIWNEPDDVTQDNFSPVQGAQFFREISNTILAGDPTAKLIVGNVYNYYPNPDPQHGCPTDPNALTHYGCGVHWLTQFISEAQALGYDPQPYIAGYGFHVYSAATYYAPPGCEVSWLHWGDLCHDAPLLANFTQSVMTAANWAAAYDPGKELWLTELNWHGLDQTGWLTQTRRMSQICATLPTLPINRYFWFDGDWMAGVYSPLVDASGGLSPAGQQFALPSTSGGCPIRR